MPTIKNYTCVFPDGRREEPAQPTYSFHYDWPSLNNIPFQHPYQHVPFSYPSLLESHPYAPHSFTHHPVQPGTQPPVIWPPGEASLCGMPAYEVLGTFNDIPVNALPDSGSAVDAVSEDFARRHGLKIDATDKQSIRLLGGYIAESVGRTVGEFKFSGERQLHRREFQVLRKSVYDVVLGKRFLCQTKTLTEFCHRIARRVRPCVQNGSRLFLLDESPKERLCCTINGADASAFPDTGSDLMLISGQFARRNKFKVRREMKHRRLVELIDGSTIHTDGMVLDAELQFDVPPASSHELDYGQYLDFIASLSSHTGLEVIKSTFICDLHVIEDLPCDIILSNDFIFQNKVFSKFKSLFHSKQASTSSASDIILDDALLFIRNKGISRSWFSRRRQADAIHLDAVPSWVEQWEMEWEMEEARRNQAQLRIASLPEPQKSDSQRREHCRRAIWDREHPRQPPAPRLTPSEANSRRMRVIEVPPPTVLRSVNVLRP